MKAKACIFDLDGTLLNTLDDLANSANEALAAHGEPQRSLAEVRRFVGNGVRVLIHRAVSEECSEALENDIFATFLKVYEREKAHYTRPYEGIEETLDALAAQGLRLAVLSNKNDDAVRALCEQYFPNRFEITQGLTESIQAKPAPDALLLICKKMGITVEEAVYVGDSEVDVATAKACGMRLVACSWGFRDKEELLAAGTSTVIDAPAALTTFFVD